jgi:hypothetical protein
VSGVYPPGAEVFRAASISSDSAYRYSLSREWGPRKGSFLTFAMLNPSTADAEKDDNTIRKCVGFARRLGFDALRVVNLYAYRTTYPADLKAAGYPTGGERNDDLLAEVGRHIKYGSPVVAAWGVHAQPDRVAQVLTFPGWDRVTALGVAKGGQPRHPLMLGYEGVRLTRWPTKVTP